MLPRCISGLGWLFLICVTTLSADCRAQEQASQYVAVALEIANWLDSVAIRDKDTLRWPMVPDESDRSVDHLYGGTAGIVLFYLELYGATGEARFLEVARAGGNRLVHSVAELASGSDLGLFTGVAGIGFVLNRLDTLHPDQAYRQAAHRIFEFLIAQSITGDVEGRQVAAWNEVTDVIGGTAGIGMYFLDEYAKSGAPAALQWAIAAGDGLLASAEKAETDGLAGLKWKMSPTFPREMPNYSHGTAGICHYLVLLDLACQQSYLPSQTYDGRFIAAAKQGAAYLIELSSRTEQGLIPHHFPGGEELFYLGWCHGPAGTIRMFDLLQSATNDRAYGLAADQLQTALDHFHLPQASAGFWDNVGLCCGNCGIAAMLIEAEQADERQWQLASKLMDDVIRRRTRFELGDGRMGATWIHCEHRVRPDLKQAQTGLMQGAAGIGITFLVMDARQQHRSRRPIIPALPF